MPIRLETERLRLRKFRGDDLEAGARALDYEARR